MGDCRQELIVVPPQEAPPSAMTDVINIVIQPAGKRLAHTPFGTFTYNVADSNEVADALIRIAAKVRHDSEPRTPL